jgi:N-acetylmuramoyl-L-alanine amidase
MALLLAAMAAPCLAQCPHVNLSADCAVLITINPNGALSTQIKSTQPYDGADDMLVGVLNKSGATVFGISLSGNDIFGFDGDGLCTYITCTWPHPTGYEGGYQGVNTTFSPTNANSGIVNFTGAGLADGGFTFFSLEMAPTASVLGATVTLDPGHGHTCPPAGNTPGQHVGTTGGGLTEDDLTVPTALAAQTLLQGANYTVVMTKTDVNSCPSLLDRAKTANHARSNVFVSVHYNAPISSLPFYKRLFASYGSEGLYSSTKSSAKQLASFLSAKVSSQLGINDQGSQVSEVNVLVPPPVGTAMTASIIEVGRLEGPDLTAIKAAGSSAKAAAGIKAAIDAFINQ